MSLEHIAKGGTLAEEVISTIRTAQAFGTQKVLSGLYNKHVEEAHIVDLKTALWQGAGLAGMFFAVYSAYALCESFVNFEGVKIKLIW